MNVGEKIRLIRLQKNISQETLHELSGVPTISIRKYESGDRTPKIEQLAKIANVLNVSLSELLGWDIYEENIRKENGFVTYLKSIGYSYSIERMGISESHVEDMIDDNGNIIDKEIINHIFSKDNIISKFTEEEFQELQKKSKENIEGAILLQNLKNKEEKSAATDDNSK